MRTVAAPPAASTRRPARAAGRSAAAVTRWQTPTPTNAPLITQRSSDPCAASSLMVCVTESKAGRCRAAASDHPPMSKIGAAEEDAKPHQAVRDPGVLNVHRIECRRRSWSKPRPSGSCRHSVWTISLAERPIPDGTSSPAQDNSYDSDMLVPRKKLATVAATGLAAVLSAGLSMTAGAPASASSAAVTSPAGATAPVATFKVSSFNVLGTSHTVNSREYESGTVRIGWAANLLHRNNTSVVGFNELQHDQLATFVSVTDDSYGIFPGDRLLRVDSNNSIAWRRSEWALISKSTFHIPYFDGNLRAMPVVRLRHRSTGLDTYFVNVHNPATNRKHPNSDPYRKRATTIEIDLINTLHADRLPIVLLGDMNEREYYFCRMTGEAPMKAARGGYNRNGDCNAENPRSVSWIFGSKRLSFDNYREAEGSLVQRITDHRVLFSDVTIDGTRFPAAVSGVQESR